MKVLRKIFLLGFGAGGCGGVEAGGALWGGGGGGVRGTFCAGIVVDEVGVAGVTFELVDVATVPGGAGSDVLALADPGRTAGFESEMVGLSAYPLYICRRQLALNP
jgi:hypothetical protein